MPNGRIAFSDDENDEFILTDPQKVKNLQSKDNTLNRCVSPMTLCISVRQSGRGQSRNHLHDEKNRPNQTAAV